MPRSRESAAAPAAGQEFSIHLTSVLGEVSAAQRGFVLLFGFFYLIEDVVPLFVPVGADVEKIDPRPQIEGQLDLADQSGVAAERAQPRFRFPPLRARQRV